MSIYEVYYSIPYYNTYYRTTAIVATYMNMCTLLCESKNITLVDSGYHQVYLYIIQTACVAQWLRRQTHKQ